jgi:hypothetical protein
MGHHVEPKLSYGFGLMAEFTSADELVEATKAAHHAGYTVMDAHSPIPIEGIAEYVGFHKTFVPTIALVGGLTGGTFGMLLEYFCAAVAYPVNVAGRPIFDIPSFIPVTYECTILFAGLGTAIGMLIMIGLPQPYHPVFNVPRFAEHATRDRFFLVIERRDPKFELAGTRKFLEGLKASGVYEVEE